MIKIKALTSTNIQNDVSMRTKESVYKWQWSKSIKL